jgi:molybdopterin-guanine dinucleotide biosynthesis protein A
MGSSELMNNYTGVILAGGENRRFNGEIKSLLSIDGKPIIERILEVYESLFNDILIVTNTFSAFKKYSNYRMEADLYKKAGPLGGIHAAMKSSESESLFVVAGDMPWISGEMVQEMLEKFENDDCEVLIPRYHGLDEPLHAIYSRSLLTSLEEFLNSSGKLAIREFLKLVKVEYLVIEREMPDRNPFSNINRPEDIEGDTKVERPKT